MYYPECIAHFIQRTSTCCYGHCEDYIRVNVDVKENGASMQNKRRLELIRKDRASANPLRSFEDLDSEFGLDDHFQIRYPVIEGKCLNYSIAASLVPTFSGLIYVIDPDDLLVLLW